MLLACDCRPAAANARPPRRHEDKFAKVGGVWKFSSRKIIVVWSKAEGNTASASADTYTKSAVRTFLRQLQQNVLVGVQSPSPLSQSSGARFPRD